MITRNIGVWVGPQFSSALSSLIPGAAFQGVDSTAYTADLEGYIAEGGSNAGAASLAATVEAYTAKCPTTPIVVSGWRYVSFSPIWFRARC
jgi:hypothetical protein